MLNVTQILDAMRDGDGAAAQRLLPLVYDELRKLAAAKMAAERSDHTLSPTALVHEAYLRLVGDQRFDSRRHFFAAAAEAMRRILIENARRKKRVRHGGQMRRQELHGELAFASEPDVDLLALDAALRKFSLAYPVHARLVELRYFVGLTGEEAASLLSISASTADRNWVFARAWLRREMQAEQFRGNS